MTRFDHDADNSLVFPILIAAVLLFACITRACPDVSAESIQDARPVQP